MRVLLDTVYEAFYARYAADFGNTFAGFFSDEPGFYNDKQVFDYHSKPGKPGVDLPWCAELPERAGVAAIPMSAFCDPHSEHIGQWNHLVRFAFCKRDETLDEAIRRLAVLRA